MACFPKHVVFSSQTPHEQLPVFNATEDVGLLPVVSPTTESGTTTVSEWAWVAASTPTPVTTLSDIPEHWGLVVIALLEVQIQKRSHISTLEKYSSLPVGRIGN